jgi:hypothetical protein
MMTTTTMIDALGSLVVKVTSPVALVAAVVVVVVGASSRLEAQEIVGTY